MTILNSIEINLDNTILKFTCDKYALAMQDDIVDIWNNHKQTITNILNKFNDDYNTYSSYFKYYHFDPDTHIGDAIAFQIKREYLDNIWITYTLNGTTNKIKIINSLGGKVSRITDAVVYKLGEYCNVSEYYNVKIKLYDNNLEDGAMIYIEWL